jgi:hypothetical protein
LNEAKIYFLYELIVYANGIVCHRAHHGAVQILACSDNNFRVYGVGAVYPNSLGVKLMTVTVITVIPRWRK